MRVLASVAFTMAMVVATLFLAGCARSGTATDVQLAPCRLKGVAIEVRCATLQRPENPAQPAGRSIPVRFAVIPAEARNKFPDPVFILAGGPGQAATDVAGQVLPIFARLNKRRDLVFIDQRGTGGSHAFHCKAQGDETALADYLKTVERCAAVFDGDARQYTTTVAMGDVDAVRAALGIERINLWGASYGTRAALEYLRQFPAHVRSVVLDGVAPASMQLPLAFAVDADQAIDQMLAACATDTGCARVHPDLAGHLDALLLRARDGGFEASVVDPLSGRRRALHVGQEQLIGWLHAPLYVPTLAGLLPGAIDDAARGEFAPLLALGSALSAGTDGIDFGMHLSVVCAEDMRRIDPAGLVKVARTRFGVSFVDLYRQLCARWPAGSAPDAFFAPLHADAPVLILSGGLDPATPPRHGDDVARTLPNARHLIAPNLGHGISGQGCAPALIESFIRGADVNAIDGRCLARIPRPMLPVALVPDSVHHSASSPP